MKESNAGTRNHKLRDCNSDTHQRTGRLHYSIPTTNNVSENENAATGKDTHLTP